MNIETKESEEMQKLRQEYANECSKLGNLLMQKKNLEKEVELQFEVLSNLEKQGFELVKYQVTLNKEEVSSGEK